MSAHTVPDGSRVLGQGVELALYRLAHQLVELVDELFGRIVDGIFVDLDGLADAVA